MHIGRVQSIAIWNTAREEILFTDSLRGSIGVLNTKSSNIEIFAGKPRKKNQKVTERDGCDGLFAQPTGICVKWNTATMVHSAAKKLNIVVLSNGLNKYFHHLHDFVFCLGLIERTRNLKLETLIKLLSDCKKFMNLKKSLLIM